MAAFKQVLYTAQAGYHTREDYPPFALAPWDDRRRWTDYLKKIAAELDAAQAKEAVDGTQQG